MASHPNMCHDSAHAAISVDPSVGQSVVLAVDLPRLGKSLVGYVTPALDCGTESVDVGRIRDFEGAFKTARSARAGAMLIIASPRAVENRSLIAELALKNHLPLMSQFSPMVEAGGLLSYGQDLNDLFRRAGSYVHRILNGAKPGDLPIEQPSKYELVVNLRTAKVLGLSIPQSLLLRADQVIE